MTARQRGIPRKEQIGPVVREDDTELRGEGCVDWKEEKTLTLIQE